MNAHPVRDGSTVPADPIAGNLADEVLERHPPASAPDTIDTFPDTGDPFDNLAGYRGHPMHPKPDDLKRFVYEALRELVGVDTRRPNEANTYTRSVTGRTRVAMRDEGRGKLLIVNTGTTDALLGIGTQAPCLLPLAVGATYIHEGMAEVWCEPELAGNTVTLAAVSERYID
jgi:hypothetical protein